jgi:tetratricopeptide (TPR) repeat protein
MDKKNLQDVHSSLRDTFNRAIDAGRKSNYGYAIELLKDVIKKSPGLTPAREKLREFEHIASDKIGGFAKLITSFKSSLNMPTIKNMLKKDPLKAMGLCEEELAKFLYNQSILNLLADASLKAGAPFVGVDALNIIREIKPHNEKNLRKLADFLCKDGDAMSALKIVQQIAEWHPNDLNVQSELRQALARASLVHGEWEKEGKTQDKVKDKEEAAAAELQDGTIHDVDQASRLITKYEKELAVQDSIDTRKKLAETYHVAGMFDKAIEEYNTVAQKLGIVDPTLDKCIERSTIAKIDKEIASLPADEANSANLAQLKQQRAEYQLSRAVERVNTYPNDTQLRYDLAVLYFDFGHVDHAIEQFQFARRNPQRKTACMVYLGRCFITNAHYDMAIEQFVAAIGEMSRMDKFKKEALYYLGNAYEFSNNPPKAQECYKEIYQSDVNFMDVGKRIQDYYAAKRQ